MSEEYKKDARYDEDYAKIKAMNGNDTIYIRMLEGGGVQIHKYEYMYFLFEIPLYGGELQFSGKFEDINKMIEVYSQWS